MKDETYRKLICSAREIRAGGKDELSVLSRRDFLISVAGAYYGAQETRGGQFPLQIIVVKTRQSAEAILEKLRSGASFASLARQYSIVPSARSGGYIGQIEISSLPLKFRTALQGLGPGQVSGLIKTDLGYVIIKVTENAKSSQLESAGSPSMGATGFHLNYRPVTDVSGLSQVDSLFARIPKPYNYQQDLRVNCQLRRAALANGEQQIQVYLSEVLPNSLLPAEVGTSRELEGYQTLAQLKSYQGDMDAAIDNFQKAQQIAVSHGLRDKQLELVKQLAIAYFHRAEVTNWIAHHDGQSSIFPISDRARFRSTQDAETAIDYLQQSLKLEPDKLEEIWLLNLACMAVGKYPHAVPSQHLIPLAPFGLEPKIGPFEDVAPQLGIDKYGMSGSVVMDDFDNDGFLDLVVSSWDPCAPLTYFHNNGDGTFSDRTEEAGLSKQLGGLNLMQTDYNNDGWLDLYILRGAWQSPMRHSLLRNNGNGTFTDVTYEAGLAFPATSSGSAVWLDFDNDGWLDLFVGNEYSPSQLFHNKGDGTFTDIAHFAGVGRIAFTKGVTAGDFDNDGFPDLYVSNYGSENFLYQNRRNGTFAEVAKQFGVEMPLFSFPTWFFDYDNDGWLDLFVSSFIHSVSEVVRSYLGMPAKGETLKLYRNLRGKGFQDATAEAGLARVFMPMGANFGDLDNDGFLDFYLGTGDPSYASMVPNVMFKNCGGKSFVDVTAFSRTGSLQKGHGVAIGDIFNTGIPCIYENIGGATPGDQYYCALFRGSGNSNKWINVKLAGRKTNRAAVGVRIKLVLIGENRERRLVYRDVNSGGSFGASPLQQHIGIGQTSIIETLEIWWPVSKTRQVFHDVAPNQFIEVHEFDKDYRRLNRRPIT